MAPRSSKPQVAHPTRPTLQVPRTEAEYLIRDQIKKGTRILEPKIHTQADFEQAFVECTKWFDYNKELLRRIVDTLDLVEDYTSRLALPKSSSGARPLSLAANINGFRRDVKTDITSLESILDRLKLIPESPQITPAIGSPQPYNAQISNRVFIVHGHDEEAKQSIARCIEKLGLEPIVLHEQPNQGRTVIEKFEDYANVGFAAILLTPDDIGAARNNRDNLQPRARQNVILELGFFIGRLGRERVCALHKGDLEIPSDLLGVMWVPLDPNGAWQFALAKEIRASGLNVDLNRLA